MSKRLNASSRITFVYKIIFVPLILIILIAFPIVATWLIRGPFALFFFFLSGLGLVLWWHVRKIKMVSFDDLYLYVKDFNTETAIKLTEIKKIRYDFPFVTFSIEMINDADDIIFLPKSQMGMSLGYWPDNIIELENRIKRNKAQQPT